MPSLKKLVDEVHRRSLWQVLGIYVVGAWIGYEVIQGLTEGMGLPTWFPSLAVVLFIIGLPIVLATAFVQQGVVDRSPGHAPGELETTTGGTPIPPALRADGTGAASGARHILTWRNAMIGGVVAFALWGVVATAWLLFLAKSDGESVASDVPLDDQVVAVLPFRISGADPALAYLREGMVDLLAAKLTGQGGPRAADPRSVLSAWHREVGSGDENLPRESSLELARSLGAGRVMLGGVVGTPTRVTLNASLLDVSTGEPVADASVSGSTDSLPDLVDDLTAQVLALEAGEGTQRLDALADTPLEALRAYLEAQSAYRGGRYGEAEAAYRRALAVDSTFALASIGILASTYWTRGGVSGSEDIEPAIALRDRLSPRDQALLSVLTTNYPRRSSFAGQLENTRGAVEIAPDRPEFWYWLGEVYYHGGAMLGIEDPFAQAEQAFSRAIALDSGFSAPRAHLVDIAVLGGDTTQIRNRADLYFAIDSVGEIGDYLRWNVAHGLGDSTALRAVVGELPTMSVIGLRAIVRQSQLKGVGSDDVDRAAAVLGERAETPSSRLSTLLLLWTYEWNRGRQSAARALETPITEVSTLPDVAVSMPVVVALYDGGDREDAERAMQVLGPRADGPSDTAGIAYPGHGVSICVTELWRLEQGETGTTERGTIRLRAARLEDVTAVSYESAQICAVTLEAKLAAVRRDPAAAEALARLDSIIREAPLPFTPVGLAARFTASRLYEERGDLENALRIMRGRNFYGTWLLASELREEGRLAALTGDREGAITAYRHYLALRSDPEPAVAEEVEAVRVALAELEAGSD